MSNPLERLRHYVTGAIERGEAKAIAGIPAERETQHGEIAGSRGLPVPILRKVWRLRHAPGQLDAEMRRDLHHCVLMLRHSRAIRWKS